MLYILWLSFPGQRQLDEEPVVDPKPAFCRQSIDPYGDLLAVMYTQWRCIIWDHDCWPICLLEALNGRHWEHQKNSRVGWSQRHRRKARSRSHKRVEALCKEKWWNGKVTGRSSRNHSWSGNRKSNPADTGAEMEELSTELGKLSELLLGFWNHLQMKELLANPGLNSDPHLLLWEAVHLVLCLPSLLHVASYHISVNFSKRTCNPASMSHWRQQILNN